MNGLLWQSLAKQADRMAGEALAGIVNLSDWHRELPGRRVELRRSLGLDPWPARGQGPPLICERGEFSGDGFRARKIAYELLPDCWGSATIYYPDPLPPAPCPAVLYNCGHTPTGSWAYQAHPILWSQRGYVCLILDSIEQNDNPGEHHGSLVGAQHEHLSLGYAASGGEAFNAIRALDVLEADPVVDGAKLGVTGVSGGGAMSYFVAALDERVRAVSTLCGICSPCDALVNRHLVNHCDCMFPLNLFQRDAADFAALIAPRAAQFCFGKQDKIYHLNECVRLAEQAQKIWDLHGVSDHWNTVVADCPHGDDPVFDEATQRWFDRHLAGEERPILKRGGRELPDSLIGVHRGSPPSPNRLALLPEFMRTRGSVHLPQNATEWSEIRQNVANELAKVLPPKISAAFAPDTRWGSNGKCLSTHRGKIEDFNVQLELNEPDTGSRTTVLSVATANQLLIQLKSSMLPALERADTTVALFEPRLGGWSYSGVGPSPFPLGSQFESGAILARAMAVVGATPVGWFYQDIQAAIGYLRTLPGQAETRLILHGKGESAVAALLVAVLDENIAGVILEDLPGSFADRTPVIGILNVLDIPQAVGLVAPRPAILVNEGHANWTWATRAYTELGSLDQFTSADCMRSAVTKIL